MGGDQIRRWALLATLGLGWWAHADPMQASRTQQPLKVDGLLDEEAWKAAPSYQAFTESYPTVGAAPTQKTEVRVLYDDHTLYVGVICHDTQPELIERGLGRRDSQPTADLVELAIDSSFDRRSAFYFSVNAAGVLRDGLLYADVNFADTWDAVWSGAAVRLPDGWSVEFAIPLSILRFPAAHEQRWGFEVRRTIPRTHQVFDSTLIPRSANALVSRFGTLGGLVDLHPHRDVEIVPYAAARLALRPQYSDARLPLPRMVDPSLDLGVDLRASLTSDLVLNATLNPDFGQVEADQIILNLSNSELFFPEKRPFFNQGLDIFEPVGAEYGAPHQLFYSRRIGLDTPIFTAAKLTGTVANGVQVGVLDALVLGPADPGKASVAFLDPSTSELTNAESIPDRGLEFHLARPLHFGLNDELPADRPTSKNYLATVARKDVTEQLSLGGMFTATSPLSARCVPRDFKTAEQYDASDCLGLGGQAVGLDWNLRSENRDWLFLGMIDGSRREGGPREQTLRDGTVIRPGDLGFGGYFKAGKFGGEGFRADLEGHYSSPRHDLNAIGFLSSQNQLRLSGNVRYVRTEGLTRVRDLYVGLYTNTFWTTDGHLTPRGNYLGGEANVTLNSFQYVGLGFTLDVPRFDVREIDGSGIPFERRGDFVLFAYAGSDANKPYKASGTVFIYRTFALGPVPPGTGWGFDATLTARPQARFETQLALHFSSDPNGARYVDVLADLDAAEPSRMHFLFGDQQSQNFSATLRQTVVFTPTLTLQAYAQLFTAYGHYPRYFAASSLPGGQILINDLVRTPGPYDADFHDAALNLNVVARWEYRLGSTLYLVYSRSQHELGYQDNQSPTPSLFPARLGPGATVDTVLIKWSYWFSA